MSTPTKTISAPIGVNYRWSHVLDEKQVSFLILDPIHDRLFIEQLQASSDWINDFASEDAIIFMPRERFFNNLYQR